MKLQAIGNNVIGTDADFGDQVTQAGIVVKSNVQDSQGITPRWFLVHSVGPDVDWVKPDQWVLVKYGRWTEGFEFVDSKIGERKKYWKLDPQGCLGIADEKPRTFYYNRETVTATRMQR